MKPAKLKNIINELHSYSRPEDAQVLQSFFKTGPGEYGEGDIFIGVKMPFIRKVASNCLALPLADILTLLKRDIHEERMLALVIMTLQYTKGDDKTRSALHQAYWSHTKYINNWDLIDISAPHLVGKHLLGRSRRKLYSFASSKDLWKRRIAIVSTLSFIKCGHYDDTLAISRILLKDREDLMHKATGWMLREVGKKNRDVLNSFLNNYYQQMPRTMLRYAIEKHSPEERSHYLRRAVEATQ